MLKNKRSIKGFVLGNPSIMVKRIICQFVTMPWNHLHEDKSKEGKKNMMCLGRTISLFIKTVYKNAKNHLIFTLIFLHSSPK